MNGGDANIQYTIFYYIFLNDQTEAAGVKQVCEKNGMADRGWYGVVQLLVVKEKV
jgi:hypothetical protein